MKPFIFSLSSMI